MRLVATYLTILLAGVALGRNIDTDQAKGIDAISQFSEFKTLENYPVQYRRNQMRYKLPNNEEPTNIAINLKPIDLTMKGEKATIPSSGAIKKDPVKQPGLIVQPIQKEDAAKVKVQEIKKDKDVKESREMQPLQSGDDKIKTMFEPKEPMTAHHSKSNVNEAAAAKRNKIITEVIAAIAKPLEQRSAVGEDNLVAKAVELSDHSVETLIESKEKDRKQTESESPTSEEKNIADKDSVKTTSDDEGREKETKKMPKSSAPKGASKITESDSAKNLLKISRTDNQLTKADDSHKRKDKNEEKKKKDDDEDDSDDEDSSDEDD